MINKADYRREYLEHLNRADEQQIAAPDLWSAPIKSAQKQDILARAVPARGTDDVEHLLSIVRDKKAGATARAVALQKLDIAISNSEALMDETLAVLNDNREPSELRQAALTVLQQASFSSAVFLAKRPEFLNVLRFIVDDKDKQLRQDALETLAAHKDEYAQRRLLEGLKTPPKALVAPEKAIQLLGYDVHAETFPILRDIVEKSTDTESKIEAVRILGADPGSRDLLQKVLQNKNEKKEVRATCAVAVQAMNPGEFGTYAKQVVMDEEEDSDIRAICLNALSLDGEAGAGGAAPSQSRAAASAEAGPGFDAYVRQMQGKTVSKMLKKAAAQYLRSMERQKNQAADK